MRIIVPMAGMGKRMRPHTLTVPKPLIPVAGKPIVQWLVEDIAKVVNQKIEEVAFVIGDFGKDVEAKLLDIAQNLGAKGTIYYQREALGTGHAIYCAEPSLRGNVVVAYADTLFKANFTLDDTKEAIIWVQKVSNPEAFGVVKVGANNVITEFVEKPKVPVSDLAIIGIYYFKDGENLRNELKYLMDNNLKVNGEFQLTDALENMKEKGLQFYPGAVDEWLDCGNKNATVNTNQRVLELNKNTALISPTVKKNNSVIINPCFIGENVVLHDSVIGPFVSLGDNTKVTSSVINNSIIQTNTTIKNAVIANSMIGNFVEFAGEMNDLSIGDYTSIQK